MVGVPVVTRWPVPAPVSPPPLSENATQDETEEWCRLEALAAVRDSGYIGTDHERMLLAGVPYRAVVEEWTFRSFPAATDQRCAALALARQFAADPMRFTEQTGRAGLGFAGAAGRGKTGLACSIAWALMGMGHIGAEHAKRLRQVRFASWPDVLARTKDVIGRIDRRGASEQESVEQILGPLVRAEVLILDDLCQPGPDPLTRWETSVLQRIIWPRYDGAAPMVVTTNLTSEQMAAQLGDAATSRLFDMLKWVPLDGIDERRRVTPARAPNGAG